MIAKRLKHVRSRIETVLTTWYGDYDRNSAPTEVEMKKWYMGGPDFDNYLTDHHFNDISEIKANNGEEWAGQKYGKLSIILLGDQFSRNIFRKQARAFELDPLCLELSLAMVESGEIQEQKFMDKYF
jgi:uncharacterized protein (DUF924 family)